MPRPHHDPRRESNAQEGRRGTKPTDLGRGERETGGKGRADNGDNRSTQTRQNLTIIQDNTDKMNGTALNTGWHTGSILIQSGGDLEKHACLVF